MASSVGKAKTNRILLLNLFGTIVLPEVDRERSSFPGGIMPDTGMTVRSGVIEALNRDIEDGWIAIAVHNAAGVMSKNPNTQKPYLTFEQNLMILYRALWLIPMVRCVYFCCDWGGRWGYRAIRVGRPTNDATRLNTGQYETLPLGKRYRLPDNGMVETALSRYGLIRNRKAVYVGNDEGDFEVVEQSKVPFLRYADVTDWTKTPALTFAESPVRNPYTDT